MEKKKLTPIAENIAESTGACLVTMVQGNLVALTVSHWIIASQTGLIAGSLASAALILARADQRWLIAVILGATTAVVDYFVHEGSFGPAASEAIVTGISAGIMSFVFGTLVDRLRRRGLRLFGRSVTEAPES